MRQVRILVASFVALMVLSAGVAIAHPMDIWDGQPVNVQFTDEHKLCKSGLCSGGISVGVVVAVWQDILYADGIATRCGSTGIDGVFGTNTRSFTMSWQNQQGLSADGVVGPASWGVADNYLHPVAGSSAYYYYDGYLNNPSYFQSGGNGSIYWENPVDLLHYMTDHGTSVASC